MSGARVNRAARRRRAWAVMLGVASAVAGCTQSGPFFALGGSRVAMPSLAPVVQEVMPAVVNVSAVQRPSRAAADEGETPGAGRAKDRVGRDSPSTALDELLRRFFDQQERKSLPNLPGTALGSGFIIDPGGYVVTDDHVVENSDRVTVTFQNGAQFPARIIGRDGLTDLALLKIDSRAATALRQMGRQRRRARRRLGHRDRQPVRSRQHRQQRHHLGPRARYPRRPL